MPAPEPTTWENIQDFFGPDEYLSQNSDGELIAVPRTTMGPPSIYDVRCGLDYAPGCVAADARWREQTTPRDVVAGVATWVWPTAATPEVSSVQRFTAALGTAAVSIVIPYVTDPAYLEMEPRTQVLRARVLNLSQPSLAISFGAGVPIRWLSGLAETPVAFGEEIEYELELIENRVAYVRAIRLLRKTIPPSWVLIDESRDQAAPVTNLPAPGYAPFMYTGEVEILFAGRRTGTSYTPPTGFVFPTDGDLTSGGIVNGSAASLKAAVRTRDADGAVTGTGNTSNQTMLNVSAWRGVVPTDWKAALSTNGTVVWPTFNNIAPGGFVLYMSYSNTASGVTPTGGIAVNSADTAVDAGGWISRLRRVQPDAGDDVAPPNTIITAAAVLIIAVRMEPVA